MPRFAANIQTMFQEYDAPDRFKHAADAGFREVEFNFPYAWPVDDLTKAREASGVSVVLVNSPPGDYATGERGFAAVPGEETRFRKEFARGMEYAEALGAPMMHLMSGVMPAGLPPERCEAALVENLSWAVDSLATKRMVLNLESLNTRDVPNYFLTDIATARRVIGTLGSDKVAFQFDTYHLQIMQGDLVRTLRDNLDIISHVQVSSLPGRHEPDQGEVDHAWFLRALDEVGYEGCVGLEYTPRAGTLEGLGWIERMGFTR